MRAEKQVYCGRLRKCCSKKGALLRKYLQRAFLELFGGKNEN